MVPAPRPKKSVTAIESWPASASPPGSQGNPRTGGEPSRSRSRRPQTKLVATTMTPADSM